MLNSFNVERGEKMGAVKGTVESSSARIKSQN
jgi:hypothetical protein